MKKISLLSLIIVVVMVSATLVGCAGIIKNTVYSFDANYHWIDTKGVISDKEAHTWKETTVKEATETEKGLLEKVCTVCGYKVDEEIPVKAPEHVHAFTTTFWRNDSQSHWHEASCGHAVRGDEEKHVYDNGTVTKVPTTTSRGVVEYTCIVCGYTHTEQLKYNHTKHIVEWKYDDENHWQQQTCCNVNPEQKDNFGKHTYDENGQCTVCGRKSVTKQVVAAIKKSEICSYSIVLDNLKISEGDGEYDLYDYAEIKFGFDENNSLIANIYAESQAVHVNIPVNGKIVELKAPAKTFVIINDGTVYVKRTAMSENYVGDSDVYTEIDQENKVSYRILNISDFLDEIGVDETYYDKLINKIESYSDAINAFIVPICNIYNKMVVANSEAVDVADQLFDSIFVENVDGATTYTINCERLHELNKKLGTMSIAQVIDYFMGDGFVDRLQNKVANLGDITIADFIDTFAGYGIEFEDIESLANAYIKYFYKDDEGNTYNSLYDMMLGGMSSSIAAIKVNSIADLLQNEIFNDMTIYDVLEIVQSNAEESEKISIDEVSEKLSDFIDKYKTQSIYEVLATKLKSIASTNYDLENEFANSLLSTLQSYLTKIDFEQTNAQTIVSFVDAVIDSYNDFADITFHVDDDVVSKIDIRLGLSSFDKTKYQSADDATFNDKVYNNVCDVLHNLFENYSAKDISIVKNYKTSCDFESVFEEIKEKADYYKYDLSDDNIKDLVSVAICNGYPSLNDAFEIYKSTTVDHENNLVVVSFTEAEKEIEYSLISDWAPAGSKLYYKRNIVLNIPLQQFSNFSIDDICKNSAILKSKIEINVIKCEFIFRMIDSEGNEIDLSSKEDFSTWKQNVQDGKVEQLEVLQNVKQEIFLVVNVITDTQTEQTVAELVSKTATDVYSSCTLDLHSYETVSEGKTTSVSFDGSNYNMTLCTYKCSECGNVKFVYLKVEKADA